MRVLTILHSLDMGGIEKTLSSCLPYFENANVELEVCCFRKGGVLEEVFLSKGIKIHHVKKTGSIVYDAYQLGKILQLSRYDVVHSRLSYNSAGFALAAKIFRIPFILSIHNQEPSTLVAFKNKFILKYFRSAYLGIHKLITNRYSRLIVGHSKANLESNYQNWQKQKQFKVVYNGIDFKDFSLVNKDDILRRESTNILHIGSFRYQKNHVFLIECFKRLNPALNNYTLTLVGDGGMRNVIENKIKEDNLGEYVELVGVTDDVGKYLRRADLFFFPSLFEGFANVMLEAQLMHVPICASKIAPHFESVSEDYHKYFFSPTDIEKAVKSLKDMIVGVNNDCFKEETERARNFVTRNFSVEKMAHNLADLYQEVVEGTKS